MKHYRIEIEGMGCAHCVRGVEQALIAINATVNDCSVGSADVLFDGDPNLIKQAIEDAGFDVVNIVSL